MNARALLVLIALVAVLLGQTAPSFSTAAFTSSSSTAAGTITAAADWTPPTVTMTGPGAAVKDTVTVSATASDADSTIRSVSIQHRSPNSTSWTELCTATTAPYSCSWNTTAGDDGEHSLRAVATDSHGNTATSAEVRTAVANKVTVVVSAPSQIIRGVATITTALHGAGSTPYRVDVEFAPTGTDRWSTACANLSSPFTCGGNTVLMPDGEYDLRATATAGSATTRSEIVRKIRVDNTAPSVTMANPGTPLRGKHPFSSTATDNGSGVAEVRLQYAAAGSSTWADLCTRSAAPYSCEYDTKDLTDGTYSFRSVATDKAGNTATSAAVTNRLIENTVSTVSMQNPGSTVSGSVPLTATASSTAGVKSVQIQYAPSGSSSWTTACTPMVAPYSCRWDSRTVTNGHYSFRAVLTDGNGKETVSDLVNGVRVQHTLTQAHSIAASNGGNSGYLDDGDRLTYTFSQEVSLGSVSPGWTGGSLPVTVVLQDGGLFNDEVEIRRGGSPVNLGTVNLRNNYVGFNDTATFGATMSASTSTVNGVPRTVITVDVGSQSSGPRFWFPAGTSNMVWSPSSAVTDLSGTPISGNTASDWNRF